MNTIQIIVSAFTAFIISAGGSIGIAFLALKGSTPDKSIWIVACVLGAVSAAKDTRSLMKLPPVSQSDSNSQAFTRPPMPPGATPLAILLLLMVLVGCSASIKTHGIPNLSEVATNIKRGGQPNDEGWKYLASIGISNVLKLNLESESSDATAEALGMKVTRFPISLENQLFGPVDGDALSKTALEIGPGTFIHCEHGQDRTGLCVAFYRVWNGATKEQAENEMLAHGFHRSLRGLWECWEAQKQTSVNLITKGISQ